MGPESLSADNAPPPVAGNRAPADKIRLRFRKDGTLRLLSHHDLMRTFERMLRRADLPFSSSQGFHPKPRIIFALSLPLGVIGLEEVAELELATVLPTEEISDRLRRQAPPGLTILSVQRVPPRTQAQVRRLCYRLAVPEDVHATLQRRIAEVLASAECVVERTRPPGGRRVDLRPFLSDLRLVEDRSRKATLLEMELWLLPAGTARPEELLTLLGLQHLLDAGVVLERARLELHDEIIPADVPVDLEPPAAVAAASAVGSIGLAPTGTASPAALARPIICPEGNA